jgi:hypothetical protein
MTVVKMPDGKTVKFPDGMGAQEIETALQGIGGDAPAQAPQDEVPWQDDVKGAIRTVGSAMTFGQTDKLADMVQEAEDYWRKKFDMLPSENTKTSKEYREQLAEEHPIISLGANVAGGILNPVLRGAGNWAMKGQGLASQARRSSGVGAGASAAQAMGESDGDLSERIGDGAKAGVIGGIIGPAIPLGIAGGQGY